MIRGVNKYMVRRTVAGGGNCKCIGGGFNGSDSNGGKIELEFTIYEVKEGTDTKQISRKMMQKG